MAHSPRVRWAVVLAGAALLVSSWLVSGSATARTGSCSSRPHLSEHRILRIARRAATASSEPSPWLIQHAQGPHNKANRVADGSGVPGCRWSYLIAERGHFVVRDAHGPPGSKPPRGKVMTLVVDAATARVTDFGVSSHYPHLARLGPVTTDFRRRNSHSGPQSG
jgi:hypothetical protein